MAVNDHNVMKSPFHHMVIRNLNMQFYATLITLIPFLLTNAWLELTPAALLTSLIGIIVYCCLIYTLNWFTAERERNLVLYGHMTEDKLRGLRAGLYSIIPLFVLTLVFVLHAYLDFLPVWFEVAYRVVFLPFVAVTNWMISGTSLAFLGLLVALLCPAAAALGYHNGYNLIQIMPKVIYKQKERPKDKRLR